MSPVINTLVWKSSHFNNIPIRDWNLAEIGKPDTTKYFTHSISEGDSPTNANQIGIVLEGQGRARTVPPFEFKDDEGNTYFYLLAKGIGETPAYPKIPNIIINGGNVIPTHEYGRFKIRRGLLTGIATTYYSQLDASNLEELKSLGFRTPRTVAIFRLENHPVKNNEMFTDDEPAVDIRAFINPVRITDLMQLDPQHRSDLINFSIRLLNKTFPDQKIASPQEYIETMTRHLAYQAFLFNSNDFVHNNLGNYQNITLAGEIVDTDTLEKISEKSSDPAIQEKISAATVFELLKNSIQINRGIESYDLIQSLPPQDLIKVFFEELEKHLGTDGLKKIMRTLNTSISEQRQNVALTTERKAKRVNPKTPIPERQLFPGSLSEIVEANSTISEIAQEIGDDYFKAFESFVSNS